MNWILLAILAVPFFMMVELISEFGCCKTIDIQTYISLVFITMGIIYLMYLMLSKRYLVYREITTNQVLTIFLVALLFFIGQNIYWNSFKKSESPGYTRAIFSGTLILSLILVSSILFKKKLSIKKIFGILSIILGIVLLS